jgi:phosphatidate cytidylyltransferase
MGRSMIWTNQFKQRLLLSTLGTIGLALSIVCSYHPLFKPFFILLNAGVISLALLEYYHLAQHKGFQPLSFLGISSSVVYMIALGFSLHHASLKSLPSLLLLGALFLFFLQYFKQRSSPLGNLAVTVFGIIYLTIPLSCAVRLNYFFPPGGLGDGRLWLAYVLIVSKMTDVGAYFVGKSLGKTPLAPTISPKKTVEGVWGGIGAALLTSLLFALSFPANGTHASFQLSLWQSIWLSLLIALFSQLGDLAESVLKRDAGVKDSSQLPGLGGILDIVDSLVFTIPLLYLLLQIQLVG